MVGIVGTSTDKLFFASMAWYGFCPRTECMGWGQWVTSLEMELSYTWRETPAALIGSFL